MRRLLWGTLLGSVFTFMSHAQAAVEITATIDLGKDQGQNFGTIFEMHDARGNVVAGAGFAGLYNTRFRHDRHTLQFFVRPDKFSFEIQELPRPNADAGCYIFDYNGRIYAAAEMSDRVYREWDDASAKWIDDPSFDPQAMRVGDLVMLVAGKPLRCVDSQVHYDDKLILDRPQTGYYHHFYYAAGHLVFFHNNRDGSPSFSRLYACKWDAESNAPIDLNQAVALDVTFPGETPFAIGQLNGAIIDSSNRGGVYRFDGKSWQVLNAPRDDVSYQLYSMLNFNDVLLMAHYPSGHLYRYDGMMIDEQIGWPPKMPGVSTSVREAQTTALYGGDLYVGVWPWAELWRRDTVSQKWEFVRRMFQQPEITNAVNHPWEQQMVELNAASGGKLVINDWGQRVTGLVPMGTSLFVSTSAKGPWPANQRPPFLTDDAYAEYGKVYRITVPGVISAPIEWKNGPTTLKFTINKNRMTMEQDGKLLAECAAPADARAFSDRMVWSKGLFGAMTGTLKNKTTSP